MKGSVEERTLWSVTSRAAKEAVRLFVDPLAPVDRRLGNHRYHWIGALLVLSVATILLLVAQPSLNLRTGAAEWRHGTLEDGSTMSLGPNTLLRAAFRSNERHIYLIRGGVLCHVARDPKRPFVVTTEFGEVVAMGTEFAVSRLDSEPVVVTVSEGSVRVSRRMQPWLRGKASGAVSLVGNQQLVLTREGPLVPQDVDAERELEWISGWFVSREGQTIGDAVKVFNRHNEVQIVIADPIISALPIRFERFRLDDPVSFAKAITEETGIALRQAEGGMRLELVRTQVNLGVDKADQ
jgi:transmembrane sensor